MQAKSCHWSRLLRMRWKRIKNRWVICIRSVVDNQNALFGVYLVINCTLSADAHKTRV
jgi:hypothetical protein